MRSCRPAHGRARPGELDTRELRHSFVSLLSDGGVALEDIADLCGHAGTSVTEKVYRHQLRPVLLGGAAVMDRIFGAGPLPPGPGLSLSSSLSMGRRR